MAGADVSGVWLAGPAKSLEFGAEVYGVNDSLLASTRKMAGSVLLPGGGGRSLTKGFLVAKKRFMDPICQEGIAPIYAWCMEAWRRRDALGSMKVA